MELSQYKEQLTFAQTTLNNYNEILTALETFHTRYSSTFRIQHASCPEIVGRYKRDSPTNK